MASGHRHFGSSILFYAEGDQLLPGPRVGGGPADRWREGDHGAAEGQDFDHRELQESRAEALFNLPYVTQRLGENTRGTITSGYSQGYISGYTVDDWGCIDFPVLGEVAVAGLTRDEIASVIKKELNEQGQATDAVVTVDFMNLYYQVLGEVEKPGRYAIDKDAVTILDAIGTAGDLTIYGKRENVKVLRNENGKMLTYEVNLCSAADLIASPAYYIRQNDVIYVDPNDVRARQSTVNGNNVRSTSFWISLTSLAASITNTIVIIATRSGSGK